MQHKHGQAPQLVALLDVDNTLTKDTSSLGSSTVISTTNQPLLNALKASGIVHVYLFTNMSTDDIQSKASNSAYFSRPELVKELEKQGFTVHGVITPIDPVYHQGLGAAYQDIFVPQYARCGGQLRENTVTYDPWFSIAKIEFELYSLVHDTLNLTITGESNPNTLKDFCASYKDRMNFNKKQLSSLNSIRNLTNIQKNKIQELIPLIDQITSTAGNSPLTFETIKQHAIALLGQTPNWFTPYQNNDSTPKHWYEKGAMYAYFLTVKPDWVQGCVYFDDKQECIETANQVNQKVNPNFPLNTVSVKFNVKKGAEPDTEDYYGNTISSLIGFKSRDYTSKIQGLNDQINTIRSTKTIVKDDSDSTLNSKKEEDHKKIQVIATAISHEIASIHAKTAQDRQDKKITAADYFSQLTVLNQALDVVTLALKNPNKDNLEACLRSAKAMESIPLFRNRLVGLLIAFVGVLALAAGIFLTVATFGGALGLALPLAATVGIGVAGVSGMGGGSLLFFRGPYKDLSNKLVEFSELQEKNKESASENTINKTK